MRQALILAIVLTASVALAVPGGQFGGKGDETFQWEGSRDVIWAQMPQPGPSHYVGSHYDPMEPAWIIEAADDFFFSTLYPVVGVEWWGGYYRGGEVLPPPYVASFTIRFYSDVPADPPDVPWSHPGDLLHTYTTGAFSEVPAPEISQWIFHYEAVITDPPPLSPGNIYWISIQAELVYDYQWAWVKCVEADWYQDEAVARSEPFGAPDWTPCEYLGTLPYMELAFVLYDEPGSPVEATSWSSIKALYR